MNDKIKALFEQSSTFCALPWVHMVVLPTGHVNVCCNSTFLHDAQGHLQEGSLKEIWQGLKYRQLRDKIAHGETVHACHRCYEQEISGLPSLRLDANKKWRARADRVVDKDGDVSQLPPNPLYLELQFSNLCNFRCRMCSPQFSSLWALDKDYSLHKDTPIGLTKCTDNPTELVDQILEMRNDLVELRFTGGEPLIIEEHYQLIRKLSESATGRGIGLRYNSNLSTTEFKSQSILDIWNQFESVTVFGSIDDSGIRGEYLRKGCKWDRIVANRRMMLVKCPRVEFYLAPTVTIFNVLHLPELIREWFDEGLVEQHLFFAHMLTGPDFYSVQIAPTELKNKVRAKYEAFIKEYLRSRYGNDSECEKQLNKVLDFMEHDDTSNKIGDFQKYTRELDTLRKEDFAEIYPDLVDFLMPGGDSSRPVDLR